MPFGYDFLIGHIQTASGGNKSPEFESMHTGIADKIAVEIITVQIPPLAEHHPLSYGPRSFNKGRGGAHDANVRSLFGHVPWPFFHVTNVSHGARPSH
jgi:hypothetical protein